MDIQDRKLFFKKAQECLLKAKTWNDFLCVSQKIKGGLINFALPSVLYLSHEHATRDETSTELLPTDANPCLVPMKSFGDGNCFYRSLSLVVFGSEESHMELRVRTIVELALNEKSYLDEKTFTDMAEYSYEGIMEYIVQVSISDNSFIANDRLSSFRNEVMLTAKDGKYSSILHLLASCNVLQKPINSIYPEAQNPGVDRDVHNQVFFPVGNIYYPETLDGIITILWTHTHDTKLKGWKPNHFVSCFPENHTRQVFSTFTMTYHDANYNQYVI